MLQYVTLLSKVFADIQPLIKSDVEGTFETGILAASWNPDESVVAIVTGVPFRSFISL